MYDEVSTEEVVKRGVKTDESAPSRPPLGHPVRSVLEVFLLISPPSQTQSICMRSCGCMGVRACRRAVLHWCGIGPPLEESHQMAVRGGAQKSGPGERPRGTVGRAASGEAVQAQRGAATGSRATCGRRDPHTRIRLGMCRFRQVPITTPSAAMLLPLLTPTPFWSFPRV